MDVTTTTPVEIDTALAALWQERYKHQARAASEWQQVKWYATEFARHVGLIKRRETLSPASLSDLLREWAEYEDVEKGGLHPVFATSSEQHLAEQAWKHYVASNDASTAADEALMDMQPLDEEYERRGRWNRAFLVTNAQGHVHKSMHCSTTYPTTQYHWVTEFSDHSEEEIVAAAGERACTVCYPSAPVGVKGTRMFTPDEQEKQRAREEREAKKAAREAAKITFTLWHQRMIAGGHSANGWTPPEYGDVEKEVTYKTARALQNDLGALVRVHHGSYAMTNGFESPVTAQHREENIRVLSAALQQATDMTQEAVYAFIDKNIKRAEKER